LETEGRVHRDISYTNILLREPELGPSDSSCRSDSPSDSSCRSDIRQKFIKEFGLSEIEELRRLTRCREGLLIDYDYATFLADVGSANEETTVEGESEDLGKDKPSQGNNLDPRQNPSGGRTVSLFFDTYLYLLRCLAGYSSFHCDGVTSIQHPSSRCT
jgi:hypothetical protein